MITIDYTVTSCTTDEFTVEAEVAGKPAQAKISGLVVEMSSADGAMGHTYRFVPDDLAAAQEAFAVGSTVTATLVPTIPVAPAT